MPLLQRKMAPFWAGLTVGIIVAIWHIPAFLLGGGVQYGSWALVPFFAVITSYSIHYTKLYEWLFLILGIPVLKYIGAALNGTVGEFPYSPWYLVFPAIAHYFFLGTLEEFGWRGLAMPLLQRKMAPFWAGLTVGIRNNFV